MTLLDLIGTALIIAGLWLLGFDSARMEASARAAMARGEEWAGGTGFGAFLLGMLLIVLGIMAVNS